MLLALFVGSGCSALIYEVVWFQQLGLVLGASAVSLAILLASFMGGMCLGSVALPLLIPSRCHPLRVYALLELLIGICGVAVLWLLPEVGRLYWSLGLGTHDLWMRSVVSIVLLLPPTVLMGATLPVIARWVATSREGLSQLGLFYGANTFGAVLGCLSAGLFLLPYFDVATATYVAATINTVVAFLAFVGARTSSFEPLAIPSQVASPSTGRTVIAALVVGLSGLTALGAEVVWTRLLGLLLGATAYTFSIVLAVFLLGLGIGSSAGAAWARRATSPGKGLAVCQLLLMLAIPYSGFIIVSVLPRWLTSHPVDESIWLRLSLDVLRTTVALLPACCLWGASFPLAVAAAADGHQDNGQLVGRLYCANTFGAILGAVGISLFAIPMMGSQFAERCLVIAAGVAGIAMLAWISLTEAGTSVTKRFGMLGGLVCSCLLATLIVPAVPPGLLACGHSMDRWMAIREFHLVREGVNSTVVVATSMQGDRCFHVSGRIEATTSLPDMRTQRILGHLPALSHKQPRTALVVGCGSGMTAGSLLLHPSIERIVICEMEPSVLMAARGSFAIQNYDVLDDPRTQVVIDDARHFLATTRETFDIITTDPIHPWVKGAAALYTAEFFDLCRQHLNRGGVVAQWIPLYESNEEAVKCELATFVQAFPFATMWSGESRNEGYDVVAIGSLESTCEPATVARNVSANRDVAQSLVEVEVESSETLQRMFAAYGSDLKDWLKDAQINHDCNLRLQYLAGRTPHGRVQQDMIERMTQLNPAMPISDSRDSR